VLVRQMEINRRFFQIAMAQQDLNGSEVRAGFQQMSREAVSQSVRMDSFKPGACSGFLTGKPDFGARQN